MAPYPVGTASAAIRRTMFIPNNHLGSSLT
jgi:hypothetical protein